MSSLVSTLLAGGFSRNVLELLFLLPVLATLIASIRQVVGVKAFGIYTSLLVSYAFVALGLWLGLGMYVVVVVVGGILAIALRRFRIHYLSRMALVLTLLTLLMLIFFQIFATRSLGLVAPASLLALVVLMTLSEKIATAYMNHGIGTALYLAVETGLIGLLGGVVLQWMWLREVLFAYPALLLLTLPVNLVLGRWSGLRLMEYWRFRDVIKQLD